MRLLYQLWNKELKQVKPIHLKLVLAIVLLIGTGYVLLEVLFGFHADLSGFTLINFLDVVTFKTILPEPPLTFNKVFPHIWFAIAFTCVVIRISVIISSYILSKKALGEVEFTKYFITYFVSFVIAAGSGLLLIFLIALIARVFGVNLSVGIGLVSHFVNILGNWVNATIPSLLNIQSYWLSIVITIFVAALPGYFVHWLSHKSRFFWYVFHRCHHCPQYLHPLATPPAFAFDFLLVIPSGIVAIIVSKLVYTQPLVMEMSLWFTAGYMFEIFNHSIAHYDFAYRNIVVRNLSRLFGDKGVYHIVHHSAKENDQTINLGAAPFMFWDRIFGTYRKPYKVAPPVGLTNKPDIKMNPFRIIYSGIAQILYELKVNKGWGTRFKIIFGSIYYKPTLTKEFLILDKGSKV